MFVGDLYLSFMIISLSHLTSTQALRIFPTSTIINLVSTSNTTISTNSSIMDTSLKNRIDQGKEIIHDAFANMDRGTLIRGTIVLTGILCLILMYIGIKRFLLRKKRQPKRYTLITDPSSMEEPLFSAHDGEEEEEEIEDDTLFARK